MRRLLVLSPLFLLGCGTSTSEPPEAIYVDLEWSPGQETVQTISLGSGMVEIAGSRSLCALDMDIGAVLEPTGVETLSVSVNIDTHCAVCTTRGDWLEYKLQVRNVPSGDYRLLVTHFTNRCGRISLWQAVDEAVRIPN